MSQPFFTIGIPTYNRHDLLREALESVLSQGFGDFEIIVGNDYTAEIMTGEMLGLHDPRIRFVNYPRNLKEVGNMNALLEMATGRYFTWLFDDDIYEPGFLHAAHEAVVKTDFPPAFFSSYRVLRGNIPFQPRVVPSGTIRVMTGRQYLDDYFARQLKIISTCGMFDKVALKSVVGRVEELCASTIGLYSEYLFLVRCALLKRIVYLDSQFVVFRAHTDSWSENNQELDKYLLAANELIKRSGEVLRHPTLADDYLSNLAGVCKIHLSTFSFKIAKTELISKRAVILAVFRAMARITQEVARIKKLYIKQSGAARFSIDIRFLQILARCYYYIMETFTLIWKR